MKPSVLSQDNMALSQAEKAMRAEFWKELVPEFSIEGNKNFGLLEFPPEQQDILKHKMNKEAYVHSIQPGLTNNFEVMQEVITKVMEEGFPPVFAFAYDEFWSLNLQIRPLVKLLLGTEEISMLPDFWCWKVQPGESGWRPHRDKPSSSLFPDGSPKSLTVWIPLTITHPLNGCMYILPADRDAIYYNDGLKGIQSSLPDFRALPGEAGDVFAWTQRVFHWGAHAADNHNLPPRQSVAFEYQRADVEAFNNPLLDPDVIPSFKARMALISKQILQYTHMYDFTSELVETAHAIRDAFGMPEATGKSLLIKT